MGRKVHEPAVKISYSMRMKIRKAVQKVLRDSGRSKEAQTLEKMVPDHAKKD